MSQNIYLCVQLINQLIQFFVKCTTRVNIWKIYTTLKVDKKFEGHKIFLLFDVFVFFPLTKSNLFDGKYNKKTHNT